MPVSLNLVFWLFYVLAAYAIYQGVIGIYNGSLNIDFHLLLIPCANGLAAFDNRWRIVSVVIALIDLLLYSILGWSALTADSSLDPLAIFGITIGLALSLAVYMVLTRSDIEVLFKKDTNKQRQPTQ